MFIGPYLNDCLTYACPPKLQHPIAGVKLSNQVYCVQLGWKQAVLEAKNWNLILLKKE